MRPLYCVFQLIIKFIIIKNITSYIFSLHFFFQSAVPLNLNPVNISRQTNFFEQKMHSCKKSSHSYRMVHNQLAMNKRANTESTNIRITKKDLINNSVVHHLPKEKYLKLESYL